jgi:hypothetical protein
MSSSRNLWQTQGTGRVSSGRVSVDEDDSAALAHQAELEYRQWVEECHEEYEQWLDSLGIWWMEQDRRISS